VNVEDKLLCQKIGYMFNNPELLNEALTHRSVRGINNERLEYLGDAILNFVIASEVFHDFEEANEGELSRLRSNLVRGDTLAVMAKEFDLGVHLRMGPGELKSGGFRRESVLADALEAVMGAVYLDSDFHTCQERILHWYQSRLDAITLSEKLKDPKTILQEYAQKNQYPLPEYKVVDLSGDEHSQTFHVKVCVIGMPFEGHGEGRTRKRAEKQAAVELMQVIRNHESN